MVSANKKFHREIQERLDAGKFEMVRNGFCFLDFKSRQLTLFIHFILNDSSFGKSSFYLLSVFLLQAFRVLHCQKIIDIIAAS